MSSFVSEDTKRRIKQAQIALDAFSDCTGEDSDNALRDLLADLMHWCGKHEVDFWHEADVARMHYEAELEEDE